MIIIILTSYLSLNLQIQSVVLVVGYFATWFMHIYSISYDSISTMLQMNQVMCIHVKTKAQNTTNLISVFVFAT